MTSVLTCSNRICGSPWPRRPTCRARATRATGAATATAPPPRPAPPWTIPISTFSDEPPGRFQQLTMQCPSDQTGSPVQVCALFHQLNSSSYDRELSIVFQRSVRFRPHASPNGSVKGSPSKLHGEGQGQGQGPIQGLGQGLPGFHGDAGYDSYSLSSNDSFPLQHALKHTLQVLPSFTGRFLKVPPAGGFGSVFIRRNVIPRMEWKQLFHLKKNT